MVESPRDAENQLHDLSDNLDIEHQYHHNKQEDGKLDTKLEAGS